MSNWYCEQILKQIQLPLAYIPVDGADIHCQFHIDCTYLDAVKFTTREPSFTWALMQGLFVSSDKPQTSDPARLICLYVDRLQRNVE